MRISSIASKIMALSLLLLISNQQLVVEAAEITNAEDADLSFLPPANDDPVSGELTKEQNTAGSKSVLDALDKSASDPSSMQFSFDNIFQFVDRKSARDLIFSFPQSNKNHPDWSNLSRVGMRSDYAYNSKLTLKTNLLLNAYTRENDGFSPSKDLRLDIKEAYFSWQYSPTAFIDMGRINIKNGVAMGFNPTDYFKVGTLLDRNTEDVSQQRDARIGSLVLRGQTLWESGSLSILASPKISKKAQHWTTNKDIYGLNLHKSNAKSRYMLKLTQRLADDFSPEVIYFNEAGKHHLGLNISRSFNDQWLGYAEWDIGERQNLVDEALVEPRKNQRLHPAIQTQFSSDAGESYQQQFAVGLSYTSTKNISTNLEYHYNEAGLSKSQSKKWFDLADVQNNPAVLGQLLSIRGLARDRNEPLGKHSLFLRSKWSDALMDKLDLTGLLIADLNDQSNLFQLEAAYELNPKSSISLNLAKFQGDRKSNYGSLDNDMTASLQLEYHF